MSEGGIILHFNFDAYHKLKYSKLGRCYPIDTLKAILGFCQKHQLHFISDEVYAMCVFDSGARNAVPFTSILALNLSEFINPNLVHVLYSFSKAWMPNVQTLLNRNKNTNFKI